jgi:hypothetical protein
LFTRKNPARVIAGHLAGLSTAARHPDRAYTNAGRDAFLKRFERLADPKGQLPEPERLARAAELRRSYFKALARRSAISRRTKKASS